jgi:hypothetical protein
MTVCPCELSNLTKELYVMYGQAPDIECEWKETANGTHGCIHSDELVATVFNKGYGWQIIINRDDVGYIVSGEAFDDHEDAQERTEWILEGAECTLSVMGSSPRSAPAPTTTDWKQQKKRVNGSATYGRKYNGKGVSVKKASNDNWFYVLHGSAPDGWSKTPKEAMRAFDIKHR